MVASSGVQKYMSIVCRRYMYLFWLDGSYAGRCHCDKSCCGVEGLLPP